MKLRKVFIRGGYINAPVAASGVAATRLGHKAPST
jgi:hypothetical protein